MAGLGFKDFQVGEVLTSSDVDGYLMQQAVMRFADSGARGSALGTAAGTGVALAEGMVSYLADTDAVEVYDGSAWTAVGAVGIGSNVAQTLKTSSFSTTSTSLTDVTGLAVTITPSRASSLVLVVVNIPVLSSANTGSAYVATADLRRDATSIANISGYSADSTRESQSPSISVLDNPATTSAVTYQVRLRTSNASFAAYIGRTGTDSTAVDSSIVAIEVAA